MKIIHKVIKEIISLRLSFLQVFCIFLAFAVMVSVTLVLGVNIERQHSEKNVEALSEQIEERLNANLHELRTFLCLVSTEIHDLLLLGADFKEIKRYITEMAVFGQHDDYGITGFGTIFAMFDVFGGTGINGLVPDMDWEKDMPDYVLQKRPWYIAADKSSGEIVETGPYVDALNNSVSFTYARSIYDNDGSRLAIICLDILLDRISKISTEKYDLGVHSWMMLDRDLTIISYPFPEFLGMTVREAIGSGIEDIADRLEQGLPVLAHRFVNPVGETIIYSVRQTRNGWYIGISTPEDSYYANLKIIQWFLISFGLLMSLVLSAILLRILAQKNKVKKYAEIILEEKNKAIEEKNMLVNLENIMNGLDAMIYVTEPETGEILFINNSMKRHFNIEGNCIGQLCYKVLQKDMDKKCDFCPCFRLNEEPDKVIIWEEHSTLTNRIYRNVDRYISWPNNKTVHIQHSVDMTEIIAAKEFAEESSRHKSAFLANMSHEIRTPMNAILGIAEIQLQDEAIPRHFGDAFGKIYESGDLLLNIINEILDLSKIDAGRMELVPVIYDMPSLINDTVKLNRLRYDSKPIEFTLHVDENTPLDLCGDELRVKQILNNILSNAFKYTDEGNIEFSVCAEPAQTPGAAADNSNEDVIIIFRVSDTGQGMTKEQVDRLFDEYTRFNIKANRTTVGAGLGMSITKRLLDIMNGSISVQSEPGKGSVFTVHLPQKRIGPVVCGAELVEKLRNFRFQSTTVRKKAQLIREYMPYGSVLVVDDVKSNIYVIKGMLLPYGLKIETASNGLDAIEKIRSGNEYDIIFMDHMMPKMDGIEAVKILRDMGYSKTIIALTANALVGRAEMFIKSGFDAFISKPVDSSKLNHVLNEFIRNKKPPEVVEAARQEMAQNKNIPVPALTAAPKAAINDELIAAAAQDVENALAVLEELLPQINTGSDSALAMYTTTVHGMKSALANIGEKQLSDIALRLEHAGEKGETATVSAETPEFMNELRFLSQKIKRPETGGSGDASGGIAPDDKVFLLDKLDEIKTSCGKLMIKDAKAALAALKKKTWPPKTSDAINQISLHLLRGEYVKAVSAVDKAKEDEVL